MTTTTNSVLSVGDAMALGQLLTDISAKHRVRWATEDDLTVREGEFRSLVKGHNDFAMLPWGTDVRDAYVWITTSVAEVTVPVVALMKSIQEGGYVIE